MGEPELSPLHLNSAFRPAVCDCPRLISPSPPPHMIYGCADFTSFANMAPHMPMTGFGSTDPSPCFVRRQFYAPQPMGFPGETMLFKEEPND